MPDKKHKKPKGSGARKILPIIPNPSKPTAPPTTKIPGWHLAGFGSPERLNLKAISAGIAPKIHGYRCIRAWSVQNDHGKIACFNEASAHLGNVVTLYHGTRANNIQSILDEGLRPGNKHCMFGSGIYLGGPGKASGYMGGGTGFQYMFEVRAALGKSLMMEKADHRVTLDKLLEQGYHSVAAFEGKTQTWGTGTLRHSEWVVYSPDQVLAVRVFEYQWTPPVSDSVTGGCDILRPRDIPLSPGMSAFADIVNEKPCGNRPTMPLNVEPVGKNGPQIIAVCAECVKRLRLKKGDKVPVHYTRSWRAAYRVEVRIKG